MITYFAPLEGVTGHVFRRAHSMYFRQPDVYYSPFLSPTKNRVFTPREMKEVLPENNAGIRLVPQLMTNNAEDFLWAAGELSDMGYGEVNLNLGCPSGTVVAKKKGSGFLSEPEALDAFFDQVFDGLSGRPGSGDEMKISVKTRLGRKDPEEFHRLLEIFNKYHISLLTVHPRIQADFYKGRPNLFMFGEALRESRNPVCYKGNIFTPADYERFTEEFPACGHVMLGRGFVANPALLEGIAGEPRSREQLMEFHGRLLEDYGREMSGERNLLFKMKELWFYMIQTFTDGGGRREKLAKKIRKAERLWQYEEAVKAVFEELEPAKEYELEF